MAARYVNNSERGHPPPESGGADEQPYEWQLLVDIGYAALERAREEIRQEEEERMERERELQELQDASEANY